MTSPIRQAVVLAGGLGSRLGTLTAETPKPLLPVGGRPFVEWVIGNLARHGVTDVILTISYRAEVFDAWLEARDRSLDLSRGIRVTTFVEDTPLDTGGALALLHDRLDEAFFVLNGDTLFDVPLGALASQLSDSQASAALALRTVDDTERYGSVRLEGSVVTAFAEKGARGPGLINGGVYAFRREVLTGRRPPLSIERDLIPELVVDECVVGLPSDGFFIDIGVRDSLEEAQRSVPHWWKEVT